MTELSDYRRMVEEPMIRGYENQIASLRARLNAAEEALQRQKPGQWQPIETAPRDRVILAFAFDRFARNRAEMHTTFWNNGRWAWFSSHYPPTHWMPLPEPPEGAV